MKPVMTNAVRQRVDQITNEGGDTMVVAVQNDGVGSRRREFAALPKDLRERVRSRLMTLEQAQAWVRLRAAFDGDAEALRETLLTAYGAQ